MVTEFDSNTFEHDYIITILGHLIQDLRTEKPVSQLIDHYACELTGFMNGQIRGTLTSAPKKEILERIAELTAQEQTYDRSTHDGAYLSALAIARIDELFWVLREQRA